MTETEVAPKPLLEGLGPKRTPDPTQGQSLNGSGT
jgi:hypothetical protein